MLEISHRERFRLIRGGSTFLAWLAFMVNISMCSGNKDCSLDEPFLRPVCRKVDNTCKERNVTKNREGRLQASADHISSWLPPAAYGVMETANLVRRRGNEPDRSATFNTRDSAQWIGHMPSAFSASDWLLGLRGRSNTSIKGLKFSVKAFLP